jgi:outer membrane protein assembly factor BamB
VPYDWLQFNGDAQHSGNDAAETALSPSNVASLTRAFRVTLPAVADGAPVVLTGVATAGGNRDLLFVTTKAGHIVALDAHTGATIWSRQNGPGSCRINGTGGACYTTSSPAIEPGRAHVYSYGLDGSVHKYAVGDGTETTTGGWPQIASLKAFDEKGSSPLTIAVAGNGATHLYVTSGGYPGDNGDYQGHVTSIDLSDGSQHVFNAACSSQTVHFVERPGSPDCSAVQSAIWARAGVVYHPAIDRIFMATGNGTFAPTQDLWGDTVFALNPDGTGAGGVPLDSFTPSTFATLQSADLDLGSTAPAILPTPTSSNVRHLALQAGKDAVLRLLNLDNLSGQGGPGHTGGSIGPDIAVPQGGQVLTAPAVWVNPADGTTWAFLANSRGIAGLRLAVDGSGNPSLSTVWQGTTAGTSPLVANGVLYVATSSDIRALAPTTGTELWHDTTIGGIHWESPVVANGTLYITDEAGALTAYTGTTTTVPALPPAGGAVLGVVLCMIGLRGFPRSGFGLPSRTSQQPKPEV